MMNKKISLGFWMAVVSVILYSCGTDNSEKEPTKAEVLADEVMAIHDEVMPKMAQMVFLKDSLQGYVKIWEESEGEETKIEDFKNAVRGLDKADKLMMDWMRGYKTPEEGDNSQEVIDYLNAEKKKVEGMKKAVLESIQTTQTLLENELKQ